MYGDRLDAFFMSSITALQPQAADYKLHLTLHNTTLLAVKFTRVPQLDWDRWFSLSDDFQNFTFS